MNFFMPLNSTTIEKTRLGETFAIFKWNGRSFLKFEGCDINT